MSGVDFVVTDILAVSERGCCHPFLPAELIMSERSCLKEAKNHEVQGIQSERRNIWRIGSASLDNVERAVRDLVGRILTIAKSRMGLVAVYTERASLSF